MVAMPGVTPVTSPPGPALAMVGSLLLQAPPGLPSLKEADAPWQMGLVPEIAAGAGFTVNMILALQPEPGMV